jgi:hypothetical protein
MEMLMAMLMAMLTAMLTAIDFIITISRFNMNEDTSHCFMAFNIAFSAGVSGKLQQVWRLK